MDAWGVQGRAWRIVGLAGVGKRGTRMQRLIYTVDIDEEVYGADFLLEAIDETIKAEIGCEILKSRLESEVEVIENGEWEDDKDE